MVNGQVETDDVKLKKKTFPYVFGGIPNVGDLIIASDGTIAMVSRIGHGQKFVSKCDGIWDSGGFEPYILIYVTKPKDENEDTK